MGFLFGKPLSIEQIFAKFNTNGNGRIDKDEAENAKNVSLFSHFVVEEGMTIEEFEKKNLETYKVYEKSSTEAWNKQKSEIEESIFKKFFGA